MQKRLIIGILLVFSILILTTTFASASITGYFFKKFFGEPQQSPTSITEKDISKALRTEYHTECRNQRCVIVDGPGDNDCTSDLQCRSSQTACGCADPGNTGGLGKYVAYACQYVFC